MLSVLAYFAPIDVDPRGYWALGLVQSVHACVAFFPTCQVQATALSV